MRRSTMFNKKIAKARAVRKLCRHFGDKLISEKADAHDYGHGFSIEFGTGNRRMRAPNGITVQLCDGGTQAFDTLQQICFMYANWCGMPKTTPKGQPWKTELWCEEIIANTAPIVAKKKKKKKVAKKK